MKLHIKTDCHSDLLDSISIEIQFPKTGIGASRNDELERLIELLTKAKSKRTRDIDGGHEATSVWFGVSEIICSHNAKGMAPGSAVPDSGYKTKLDR